MLDRHVCKLQKYNHKVRTSKVMYVRFEVYWMVRMHHTDRLHYFHRDCFISKRLQLTIILIIDLFKCACLVFISILIYKWLKIVFTKLKVTLLNVFLDQQYKTHRQYYLKHNMCLFLFPLHQGPVNCVAFSRTGEYFSSGGSDEQVMTFSWWSFKINQFLFNKWSYYLLSLYN